VPERLGFVFGQVADAANRIDLELLDLFQRRGGQVVPFDGAAEYPADAAHLPIRGGWLVSAIEPGRADLLQVAACYLIEAAEHDRLEAGVECVQRLFVALVVRLEPRQIGVIDELAQGRGTSTSP